MRTQSGTNIPPHSHSLIPNTLYKATTLNLRKKVNSRPTSRKPHYNLLIKNTFYTYLSHPAWVRELKRLSYQEFLSFLPRRTLRGCVN